MLTMKAAHYVVVLYDILMAMSFWLRKKNSETENEKSVDLCYFT